MPWTTPTLSAVRQMVRDNVTSLLRGAAMIANNVLRVISDATAGVARLVLEYIDWLALQLLPDTAETEWLDRHGNIWLVNSDGTTGRKLAALASGTLTCTGSVGVPVPAGTVIGVSGGMQYQTTEQITIGAGPTPVTATALLGGTAGNLDAGLQLSFATAIGGVDGTATVVSMTGGTDQETDDELRTRVLLRIQNPPMGGDANDYVQWALAVPGITRAWCYPNEMGIGTVTTRFMCDDLRAGPLVTGTNGVTGGGFPQPVDVAAVTTYLDTVRPVAVKDHFEEAPIPQFINFTIRNLDSDDPSTRANIAASVTQMLFEKAIPGQTIYRNWLDGAINAAQGVDHYDLDFTDTEMFDTGHLAVLGTVTYQ